MKKSELIIGIDGGGTKTSCILFDTEGNIIDRIIKEGSNLYVFKENGVNILLSAINKILKKNKLNIDDINAYGIAVAGISDQNQKDLLLKELDRIKITSKTILLSDVEAAYRILCPKQQGLLVNIGTGIICFAKDDNGKIIKEAGNGFDKGDIGSGYWLGKELFYRLILNEALVFEDDDLKQIFDASIDKFNVKNFREMYQLIEQGDDIFCQLSSLGQDAIDLAMKGNDVALSIVQEGTRYVADYILNICERLDMINLSEIIIAINGNVIKNNFYRKMLNEALQFDFKKIHWVSSDIDSAIGAGILASNYKGIDISLKTIIRKHKN
ncbi:MAG: hypothetical protein CMG49_02845 [Candidatus Marinimicrobia bacterium]|nr:hypothetical protein [Candidatus Neomarinimicrobiota bacterium]